MDTPGFSSLYTNDFEKEELKHYFPEFFPYEDSADTMDATMCTSRTAP